MLRLAVKMINFQEKILIQFNSQKFPILSISLAGYKNKYLRNFLSNQNNLIWEKFKIEGKNFKLSESTGKFLRIIS